MTLRTVGLVFLLVVALAPAPVPHERTAALVSHEVPVRYVSQLAEPAPHWWRAYATPYCAAAASLTVMESFGVALPAESPLRTVFEIGRAGNTTDDPGLDPDGIAHLMRSFGGEGRIHAYADRGTALDHLIGRLNAFAPVVALTQAGNHAVTVYGYEALSGGPVTALYVADPLSGYMGRVAVERWLADHFWMGTPFSAAGAAWRGTFVFVTYVDARASAPAAGGTAARGGSAPVYRSGFVAQGAYPSVARGAITTFTVTLRNTGTVAWVKGTPTEVRLGVPFDDRTLFDQGFAYAWVLPSRPAVQVEPNVAPSETATFVVGVRGALPGSWTLRLRPVVDGVTWLEDHGIYAVIDVR